MTVERLGKLIYEDKIDKELALIIADYGAEIKNHWVNKFKDAMEKIPQFRCDTKLHDPSGCPKCKLFEVLEI